MGESVVLPILIEAAKPMINLLAGRVKEEIDLVLELKQDLSKLQSKMEIISSIVNNMTATKTSSNNVEPWVRNIVNALYNAEDMLDVLNYEKQRQVVVKRRRPKRSLTGLVIWPLKRLYFRRKIGKWISRINSNIDEAVKMAVTSVQLKGLVQSNNSPSLLAANESLAANDRLQQLRRNLDTSLFVGRDSDIQFVVDKLCNSSQRTINRLSVVAIVGLGGIGKTLVANEVYENERVRNHFSKRIWIPDSKDFNIERILNKMEEFRRKDSSEMKATRNLEEYLGGKRYLLVLDDVWDTHQQSWDTLRKALERIGGSEESMVLVTTRDKDVPQIMHASSIHELPKLSEDDSWSLFKGIALSNEDFPALEAIGKEIVKKCNGVPLAIKSIAGTLQRKRNSYEWTSIEQSNLWNVSQDVTGILPSLKLSYDHLASPLLKKCFSLWAIFPRNCTLAKYELIGRWMALGLLPQTNGDRNLKMEDGNLKMEDGNSKTMEDFGEENIEALLSISFLLVHKRNEVGEVISYAMHDLVYDLARSIASHESLHLESGNEVSNDNNIRHLTVVGHVNTPLNIPDKMVLKNLRILEIFKRLPGGLLMHVKYLRVLCLERLNLTEVPDSISQLKCLKYLDLASNPIKELPECIMELYSLQSLILYHCKLLSELPKGLDNLENLRHLGLSFSFPPAEGIIRQLKLLQYLPPLQLSEGGFKVSELQHLHQIRGKLDIRGLEHIKSKQDAELANLSMKHRVDQLKLTWDNDENCTNYEEVLDGFHPNSSLKMISINGYASEKFPSWLMKMNVSQEFDGMHPNPIDELSKLQKIELIDCGRCQQLPTLGHLPSLKMLELRNLSSLKHIGPEFYCGNSSPTVMKSKVYFSSLVELHLYHLYDLVEWCTPVSTTGFPLLKVLIIAYCLKLRTTPNNFPSLEKLFVTYIGSCHPLLNIITNKNSLKYLHINNVWELTHIPESLSKLLSIEVLEITQCPNLESLPNLSGLGLLRDLVISGNDNLMGAPEGLLSCKSLEELCIHRCPKINTLPDLTGLRRLAGVSMVGMMNVICKFPDWLYNSPCLRSLSIGGYKELEEFPDISFLSKITSLRQLLLYGWDKLQTLPEQLQHFKMLEVLEIVYFENMENLPDWLGNLSSLKELHILSCNKLKKLPSADAMKRLTKLWYLGIGNCPLLEEAVKVSGTEHNKITHIEVDIVDFNDPEFEFKF